MQHHLKLVENTDTLPLTWAAMPKESHYTNFGDALGAVICAAISQRPIAKYSFDSKYARIASVGTIMHNLCNGEIHVWGTGLDVSRNPTSKTQLNYQIPPNTDFRIHAVRGCFTRDALVERGLRPRPVFGDPGLFAGKVWPQLYDVKKKYELGVVLHLTELVQITPSSPPKPELIRYSVPEKYRKDIAILTTVADRSLQGIESTVTRIAECRRIVSTSLHGLVIAEMLKIPCQYFGPNGAPGGLIVDIWDRTSLIDHRMRDFYSALQLTELPTFAQPRHIETNWSSLIDWIDGNRINVMIDTKPLFDSFPLERRVNFDDRQWIVDPKLLSGINI
jgi:hypothetical protein